VGRSDLACAAAPPGALQLAGIGAAGRAVADEAGVWAATDRVLGRFGQVDVLVNNAGISLIAPAEATPVEQWRRVLEVNLTGPFLLSPGIRPRHARPAPRVDRQQRLRRRPARQRRPGRLQRLQARAGRAHPDPRRRMGRPRRPGRRCLPGRIKTEMDVAD
jgi:NAD(P)-dependent dehydrogenase (short-subunit alcohol dehydrogenase family)